MVRRFDWVDQSRVRLLAIPPSPAPAWWNNKDMNQHFHQHYYINSQGRVSLYT